LRCTDGVGYISISIIMAPPQKKRKVSATNGSNGVKLFPNPPLAAATLTDKQRWQGFCEIESEPVSVFPLICRLSRRS